MLRLVGCEPATFEPGYTRPAPDLKSLTLAEQPILARGLAAVPQDRWPSCMEMMDRLTKCVKESTAQPINAIGSYSQVSAR